MQIVLPSLSDTANYVTLMCDSHQGDMIQRVRVTDVLTCQVKMTSLGQTGPLATVCLQHRSSTMENSISLSVRGFASRKLQCYLH